MLGNNILIGAAGAGGADAGHIIEGSGLFTVANAGQLSKTFGTPTNNKIWTAHLIVKKTVLEAATALDQQIFGSHLAGTDQASIAFQNNEDVIRWLDYSGSFAWDVNTDEQLRDIAGYYVFTVALDTTQAVSTDRLKIWSVDKQLTLSGTFPALNAVSKINGASRAHSISGRAVGATDYYEGYIADVTFIDGYALDPTDFGSVTDNGFWQINKVEETYAITGSNVTGAATDNTVSAAVASTYTFSNQAIGTATSDRVVIVNFGSLKDTSATFSVTSVTIGGVSATKIHSAQTLTSFGLSSYYATVPTGTTADIVIVHSANMNRVGIQVVTTTNIGEFHQVALAEASSGSDALSFTVDAPAGSLVVGYVYDTGSSSHTWSELTENFDEQVSTTHYHSGAIKNYSSAATPTITADPSGSSATFGLVVVFQPKSEGWTFGNNGFLIEGGTDMAAGTDSNGTNQPGATPNLLIHSDTTNDSTTAVNSGADGSAVTMNGNTKHVTAQKVFGTSSILFPGSSGDYVSIPDTAATEMGAKDFTIECRVRLDAVGSYQRFVSKYNTVGTKRTWSLSFSNAGLLIFQVSPDGSSTATISESWSPSADTWYALRVTRGGGKIQLYVDGTRLGSGTANTTTVVDNDTPIELGSRNLGTADLFAGHMDEIMVLMGTALTTASSYTVPTSAYDTGNSFLKTGTITATNDSPTNDADNGYGNYATSNPLFVTGTDKANAVFSNGNMTFGNTGTTSHILSESTILASGGKWYFEVTHDAVGGGTQRTGVVSQSSTNYFSQTNPYIGIFDKGFAYAANGNKENNESAASYGSTYTTGDIIGVAVDLDNGNIFFSKNGTFQNSATIGEIEAGTGTNAAYTTLSATEDYMFGHSPYHNATATMNNGQEAFSYTAPTGFLSLATQNLPTPDVISYEDEYYIEANISHTSGSTTAVTLPKTVSGGAMARIKRTNTTGDWYIFDTVRGANKSRKWNEAEAEDTSTFDDQNLTGTTLTLPSDLATGTYLVEVFYVGSYFQIQTVTGNAGARTITWPTAMDSYGFSAFFPRTGASSGISHHKDIGAQQILFCDNGSTAANRTNFSQAPNKTDFRTPASVGPDFNLNTIPYVCYGWANSGPYAFGSFEGNGSADGNMVALNGAPVTFGYKNIDAAQGWVMHTTKLSDNQNGTDLSPQATNAPPVNNITVDLLSNGWKLRFSRTATHIYWAFGIQPLTDSAINQVRAGRNPGVDRTIANGGSLSFDGDYVINTFNASGTISFDDAPADGVEYLVIAGGGGGGSNYRAGGGGGGGYRTATGLAVTDNTSYAITVGAGGAGGNNTTAGTNGGNSIFSSITSSGGGGGGAYNSAAAKAGGSGGGSAGHPSTNTVPGAASPAGQGHAGGDGFVGTTQIGGGGGGAGAVGFDGTSGGTGGDGGAGLASSITGSEVFRAGGGGAGAYGGGNNFPVGGVGGGANGIHQSGRGDGPSASANTGGGGGGSSGTNTGSTGGTGGSGVVIIRYKYQ